MTASADVYERAATDRRLAADFFDELDDRQLDTPSLCDAWTVRQVLGHLVMPLAIGLPTLLLRTVRAGFSVDRGSAAIAADLARRPVGELTGLLRERADQEIDAAVVGPMGQLSDACIHLRDCARPLGLPHDVPLADWYAVLDWLPSKQASRGLVRRGLLDGLALRATDQHWSYGEGAEIAGTSEALVMALTGRGVVLDELVGPGTGLLRDRLASR
ncbi:MAG: maleylpyruvate isomerase family mycothiol-dependent enzyme [Marmoricola sp.]